MEVIKVFGGSATKNTNGKHELMTGQAEIQRGVHIVPVKR